MSDDVFRIFRQTGRRIALIKEQVERERSSYLKESYMEKKSAVQRAGGNRSFQKGFARKEQGVGRSRAGFEYHIICLSSSKFKPANKSLDRR